MTAANTPRPWVRYSTVEEKFAALTEFTPDGHLRWTGPMDGQYPLLKHGGRKWAPLSVAFRQHYGREPIGRIRVSCDRLHCLLGAHLDDTPARASHRAAIAVLFSAA